MPKRESENSQLSKEEYDLATRESSSNDDGGGKFKRASETELKKRRMLSARKRRPQSLSSAGDGSSRSISPPPAATTNPFAKVSLTAPKPSIGFSFGTTTTTPAPGAVPAAAPATAGFSFGKSSSVADNTNKPFSFTHGGGAAAPSTKGVSFAPSPEGVTTTPSNNFFGGSFAGTPAAVNTSKPAGTPFVFGGVSSTTSTGGPTFSFGGSGAAKTTGGGAAYGAIDNNKLASRFQKHAVSLEKSFFNECSKIPNMQTAIILPLLDHYLDAVHVLEDEYWKRVTKENAIKSTTTTVAFSPSAKPGGGGGGGFQFGGGTPAPKGGFSAPSFGGGTPAPPIGGISGAPAGGGGETDGGPSDTPSDKATVAAPGAADQDYETLATLNNVAFYVGDKKNVSGNPKLQLHKNTKKLRLIMRDEASGKVRVNMAFNYKIGKEILEAGIKFFEQKHKKYSAGVESARFFGNLTPEQSKPAVLLMRRRIQPSEGKLEDLLTEILKKHGQP